MDARKHDSDIVSIREIFVVQPGEADKHKGEFNIEPGSGQPEQMDLIFNRMVGHIRNMGEVAKQEHLQRNFDNPDKFDPSEMPDAVTSRSCRLKENCQNEITRLTFQEFHFYPYKESGPLSQKQFSRLIKEIEKIARDYPENLHMILSSFPIVDKNNIVHNVSIYVQCGKDPKLSSFAKVTESRVDLRYDGVKNFSYRSDLQGDDQADATEQASRIGSIPSIVAGAMRDEVAFSLSGVIPCVTAGGKQFTAIVDICLDYSHEIGKSRLIQLSEQEKKHGRLTETTVSHTVSSNSISLSKESMISPLISHADPYMHGIFPGAMQEGNEIRSETEFAGECRVLFYDPIPVGKIDIIKFLSVYNGNLKAEYHQLEEIASKKQDIKSKERLH